MGDLLGSAHDVAREARILTGLTDAPVPTPRVLGLTDDPEVTDAPLLLMEFAQGRVVDRMSVAEQLTPEQRGVVGLALSRTLADVHAVDLAASGLLELASHKPYAPRQLKRWSSQWEHSKTREHPGLDDLTGRLRAAVPEQHELTLVHGDYHLRNVILSEDLTRVSAVLDWELCTLGDPLADLGSLLAYWTEPGEHTGGDFPVATLPGFPTRAVMAEAYFHETGRDPSALGFWHALGLWKVAIIAEGVMDRAMRDPTNAAASGTPTVELVDAFVSQARAVAAESDI